MDKCCDNCKWQDYDPKCGDDDMCMHCFRENKNKQDEWEEKEMYNAVRALYKGVSHDN